VVARRGAGVRLEEAVVENVQRNDADREAGEADLVPHGVGEPGLQGR
jgi:hypothetical protein